ncbi:MAG: hypothetical protein KAQ98_13225 [Bacteriovoracaceae bacterium]|nr:hypothetical protein [Bacteriovoracaceae bacterium]
METNESESSLKCREVKINVKTGHSPLGRDKLKSNLITDLSGVRHLGGVNIIQAIVRNLGSSRSDVKGEIQVVDTIRMRVPMLNTVADQLVVAMKPSKVGGAKGLSYSVLQFGQLTVSGGTDE